MATEPRRFIWRKHHTKQEVRELYKSKIRAYSKNDGECWIWQKGTTPGGYGTTSYMGRLVHAHRISYLVSVGPLLNGLDCRHSCDVRLCVNPGHLSMGTRQDNMLDASSRGRINLPSKTMKKCRRGHRYTKKNTRHGTQKNGKYVSRTCKTCWNMRRRMRRRLRSIGKKLDTATC